MIAEALAQSDGRDALSRRLGTLFREQVVPLIGATTPEETAADEAAGPDAPDPAEAAADAADTVDATDTTRTPTAKMRVVEPPPSAPAEPLDPDATLFQDTVGDTARLLKALAQAEPALFETVPIRMVLDNVKDAILTVDHGGRILSINTAGMRMFQARGAQLTGRSIEERVPSLGPDGELLGEWATGVDDTIVDFEPHQVEAHAVDGSTFAAEMTVSRLQQDGKDYFVLCVRDVSEKLRDIQALKDSEARYRALVENAPEAIVVLDVDQNRFVDANENAARLFKLSREELLRAGPENISPEHQADGLPSFGLQRGYIDRALKGGRPVFEWLHRDADGREIPCEVRFIRLPSSSQQLIRASVIDVAARRRADAFAFGERRVLELIAANASLKQTLEAVVRLVEQLHPDLVAAVSLLDESGERIRLEAAGALPDAMTHALSDLPVGLRSGACGAAASLGRQIVTRDIATDNVWSELRDAVADSGIRACCSTPIVTSGGRIHGTVAFYFDAVRGPTTEELDLVTRLTQLAGIAIRRKQDETALRDSEARYRSLFDNVADGVFQITPAGELLSANPALLRMLGYDAADGPGELKLEQHFVKARDRERLLAELARHGRVRNFEYALRRRDGSVIVVLENSRRVTDDEGRVLYYEGTITDITQRKAAERALYKEKERAQVTLKSIGDAVVTTDADGRVEYLNPVAEQLTGWERRAAQGRHVDEIIRLEDDTGEPLVEAPVLRCLHEGRVVTLVDDAVLVGRDGARMPIQDSAAPIQDRDGRVVGAVMVFHDVSRERRLHRKLSYHASHDSLTGLINRREFEERISEALRDVRDDGERRFALLYMDLDQFKVVNDTCGHAAGDLLLRQLSEVLQARVRTADVLARLGGDEFAVLLADCGVDDAAQLADTLRQAIADFRFSWRDGSMQVGVSIGIVPVEAGSESVGSLLSAADVACYVAKDLGRNRIHIYEEGDAAERHQEMQWVGRINRAREQERLELYFQPIVAIGQTNGEPPLFELLLRMRDENGSLVAPTSFIPAAERYNLMPSLDRWVIQEVLLDLVYREQLECEPYSLAVNLSGTTLNDARFLDFVLEQLNEAGVPAGALCFEITETAAISNLGRVVHFMRALQERGCRFALDDFGTGLSSLTYLKNLPVDYVKIDGQFVRNVTKDPADQSVVEAIAQMARAFKIKTIAERVESRQVLDRLAEIGIGFAQGYFVAVPRPVSELPLRARTKRIRA
jgi:diguanylate cyclase (GGDEF)-like protein/PAS domain S-box-containing protein